MTAPDGDRASNATGSGPLYATFPRRLNALTADSIVLIVFSLVILLIRPDDDNHPAFRLGLALFWWAAILLYEPVMVTWFGGTLGHQLLNLRVVDEETGGNVGMGKALGRFVIKGGLGIVSFFSMSFSRKHQALHDMMTTSTVQIRDPEKAARHHYVRAAESPTLPKDNGAL